MLKDKMTFSLTNYLVPVIFWPPQPDGSHRNWEESIHIVQRFAYFLVSKKTILIVTCRPTGKTPTVEGNADIYYHTCAHYGCLWQGSIKINFYVSYVFSLSNVLGIVFISQLRQTVSIGVGGFFPPVRNNENCNFNTTAHNQWMEEIKCYISEQNIKKCFKFFMFLQLEKYSKDHAKRETRILLERNSNTLRGTGKDFGALLAAHSPTAPRASWKGAGLLTSQFRNSHASFTWWPLTNWRWSLIFKIQN